MSNGSSVNRIFCTPEREFLLQFVNDPRDQVSVGTIRALGTLGDEQALPVLTTFTRHGEWSPKRTEAERAIRKINESWPVQPELGDLRKEIPDLKKANEDPRKDFNKLGKQFDATTQAKKSAEDRRGPKVIRSPRDRANH